jgi:hypothetical protein
MALREVFALRLDARAFGVGDLQKQQNNFKISPTSLRLK